jgi:polyhydroxyalkanoate synthesis regulator phasin
MAEEPDNLIVHLLRELRADLGALKDGQADGNRRLTKIERHIEEMKETLAYTAGVAMHSGVVVEKTGENFDEIRDQLEALRRRVADLEMRT